MGAFAQRILSSSTEYARRQIYGALRFKLGHCENQNRPQGLKTGQHHLPGAVLYGQYHLPGTGRNRPLAISNQATLTQMLMAAAERNPTSRLCRAAPGISPQAGLSGSPPSAGAVSLPLADAK